MNRGDVWWFEPPNRKRRPVVILTRDDVIPHLNQLTAAPVTRHVRSIPTEVDLGTDDGMPTDCVASLDNLMAIRPAFLTDRITHLGAPRMAEVCEAIRRALAC